MDRQTQTWMLTFWKRGGTLGNQTLPLQPQSLPDRNIKLFLGQTVGLGSSKEKREQKPGVLLEYSYFGDRGGWVVKNKNTQRKEIHRGRDGDGAEGQIGRLTLSEEDRETRRETERSGQE